MNKFFKYFKVPFILLAILAVVTIGIRIARSGKPTGIERNNTETDLTTNVFNFAGNLEPSHVAALESLIESTEEEVGCDIAIITLDETLEGRYNSQPYQWVRDYAADFAAEHSMGYDKPNGNIIIFVDNIYREPSSGKVHSWLWTNGLAEEMIPTSEAEEIMDVALEYLTDYSDADDFYSAYAKVIELVPGNMRSTSQSMLRIFRPSYILIFALVVALLYILINWTTKAGVRTTVSTTYVENGRPNLTHKGDVFLRKTVTKRKIQTSSSSGGGGGGHGGGHSR
ncbi:MAG: TPM domain-containing protein [Lachnospiraceae bacterium]|nr:TPM domain-containing protein [Lachnospiraceae bacterium]